MTAALSGVVIATGLVVSPASAAPPAVVVEGDFENTFFVPAADDVCGVDTMVHEVGSVKITEFYDNDGDMIRARRKVMGTTTVTTEFGQVVDRWSENGTFDPGTLTVTVTGNPYNVHAGTGGVLVNDSGRIVIDTRTDEALVVNGPHQARFGEFEDACAVLAP
jgi:Tfp pilus tip-associated adhesin PilY1